MENKCDICQKPHLIKELRKIEIDWNHQYVRVCSKCVLERGAYMIACRIDKPKNTQNIEYQKIRNTGFE